MTVIAWDGRTLAADKRMSFGTEITTTKKIHCIDGMLVGCAGDAAIGRSCVQWVREGMDKSNYPEMQRTDPCSFLVIHQGGAIHYYGKTPDPLIIEDDHFTIGSGGEFARAALYLGKTAREAVEVACALDSSCGNGIDVLTLESQQL